MDDNKRASKIRKQRRSERDGITKEHQRGGSLKSGEGDDVFGNSSTTIARASFDLAIGSRNFHAGWSVNDQLIHDSVHRNRSLREILSTLKFVRKETFLPNNLFSTTERKGKEIVITGDEYPSRSFLLREISFSTLAFSAQIYSQPSLPCTRVFIRRETRPGNGLRMGNDSPGGGYIKIPETF